MNCNRSETNSVAFTLLELLIVIAVLILLAAVFFPTLHDRGGACAKDFQCVNNLKQVGLAFRVWEGDHNDKFPMQVSVTNGGAMGFVGGPETFRCFEVMSNEINTPKILFCPLEDRTRWQASVFGNVPPPDPDYRSFSNNTNLSYFVGADATDMFPEMFLSGDRNLTNGTLLTKGILNLTTNRPAGWTDQMHIIQGNIGLVDGSVQRFTRQGLRTALEQTGTNNNRLAVP
jgi:competence protein ComGC